MIYYYIPQNMAMRNKLEKILFLYRHDIAKSAFIAIAVCALYFSFFANLIPLKIANLKLIDGLYAARAAFGHVPVKATGAVLIAIDDESLKHIELRWPWPRGVIASIIKKISENKPSVIHTDLFFPGKGDREEQDTLLAKAIGDAGNVILASYIDNNGKHDIPDRLFAAQALSFGFVNKPRDPDNVLRRMRPFIFSKDHKDTLYPLSLKTAARALNIPQEEIAKRVPILKDNTAYIPFLKPGSGYTAIPVWHFLEEGKDVSEITGKMVFLGLTAGIFHDYYSTPFGIMPGVCVNINEALAYTNNNFFRYVAMPINIILTTFLIFMIILINTRLRASLGISLSIFTSVLFIIICILLFLRNVIVLDMFGLLFLTFIMTIATHGMKYITVTIENANLRKEAVTDGLTGLYVHRYFELKLKSELAKAITERTDLALVIFDVDHFKKINDTYGHEFGNVILKSVSGILKSNTKKNNTVARYGGEEFCVIAPNTNDSEVYSYAERIRALIEKAEFVSDSKDRVKITISAGAATTEKKPFVNHSDMTKAADAALYISKDSGRNRVTLSSAQTIADSV